MKKSLCALFLLLSFAGPAQSFEGELIFKNTLKTKSAQMSDEQWTRMMGSRQEYFIKEGNYKSVTNGTVAQWQLYIQRANKVYTKMSNSESVLWNDASENSDEILHSELKKNVENILGYACDELILTCKSGVQKYYFSDKIAVNPHLYENHNYGNWYAVLKTSKALPLKTIIETPQFVMETIVLEIKPMALEDSLFSLRSDTKIVKSPY